MNFVDLIKAIGKLKKTKRTGWVRMGIPNSESVAEHIMRTAALALFAGPKLDVDTNKLIKMALVHDMGESVIGDIVIERGGKIVGPKEEKYKNEKSAINDLLADLENGGELISLWEEFEEQKTEESKILKQLDRLEMVIQALDYEGETKQENLNEFWETARATITNPIIRKWFEELEGQRKK